MRINKKLVVSGVIAAMLLVGGCGKTGDENGVGKKDIDTTKPQISTTEEITTGVSTEDNSTTEQGGQNINDTESTEEITTEGNDSQKPHVEIEPFCEYAGTCGDDYSTWDYTYILPAISGVETDYVNAFNADMNIIYNSEIKDNLEYLNEGQAVYNKVNYSYYHEDGIYSIMIYIYYDWDSREYIAYNFDEYGNEITNKELLSKFNHTEDEFISEVWSVAEELTSYSGADDSMMDEIQDVRERTLTTDNINMDIPIFINEKGELSYIVRAYSIAGADSYNYEYVFGDHTAVYRD